MRKVITVVWVLGFFTMPLAASADQISDLQAQIHVLSQMLAELQKKSGTGSMPFAELGAMMHFRQHLLPPGSQ